jgi:AcrR family transcriptional regulator
VSPRAEPERRRPRPRTHAERTAETRGAIMRAVVEAIAELGFKRATASEIARRAGVTWGAVQHHFGGKDGILVAVLEDSFQRFAARLSDIARDGQSLERRAELFLERAWEHFASPHFRSTFEILQHDAPRGPDGAWQGQMLRAWDEVWSSLFGDAPRSRGRRLALQHYTISVLTGLALLRRFEEPSPALRERELALLRETLVRELGSKGTRA